MQEVRPSAPNYWEQVASLCGQRPEACRRHAFGGGGHNHVRQKIAHTPRKVQPPPSLDCCPKRDGPRRAKKIRNFLNAHNFSAPHDFLSMLHGEGDAETEECSAPVADTVPSQTAFETISKFSIDFSPIKTIMPANKTRSSLLHQKSMPKQWQPIGLDSFICHHRHPKNTKRTGEKLLPNLAPHKTRHNVSKLFQKIDAYENAQASADLTPQSCQSNSDDDFFFDGGPQKHG